MKANLSSPDAAQAIDERLEQIIEAVTNRLQNGEQVVLEDLAAAHPDYADQLRELLPAVQMLVHLGNAPVPSPGLVPTSDGRSPAPPPQQLGDFRLVRPIGRGGMGTVFEAEQISMGRRVALKVLPFAALAHEKSLQRFRNEVRAAAALDHPYIVSVYSVGEERGIHYFAMQLIRGQTLAELIDNLRRERPTGSRPAANDGGEAPTIDSAAAQRSTIRVEQAHLSTAVDSRHAAESFRAAARLGIQAAEALQHAHDLGVLHRDVKPSNLMVDKERQLFVTDFGLARIEADAGLTMTGDIIGTLRYMAPEQALAKRVVIDHRADVYSLGATLYELLTLEPAFGETDRSELMKQIAFEEPRPLRKIDRRIPTELETIVLKAMAKNPDERYQTAQAIADDLQAFLENMPIKAKPPSAWQRAGKWSRRHRPLVASAGLSAAALVILSIAVLAYSNVAVTRERNEKTLALRDKTAALEQARIAAAESKAVINFLVKELLAAPEEHKKLNRELTISEVLANAEKKVATALVDQPLVEASVRQAIAGAYLTLEKPERAEPQARRALAIRSRLLPLENDGTLQSLRTLEQSLVPQHKRADARQVCAEALKQRRKSLGTAHRNTVETMGLTIWVFLSTIEPNDEELAFASKLAEEHFELCRKVLGSEDDETLDSMHNMSLFLALRGEDDKSAKLDDDLLAIARRALGPDHYQLPSRINESACDLLQRGKVKEAAALYREAFELAKRLWGLNDGRTAAQLFSLAGADGMLGKHAEAAALYGEAMVAAKQYWGAKDYHVLKPMLALASVDGSLGNADEASQLYKEAFVIAEGAKDYRAIEPMLTLASVEVSLGKTDEARQLCEKALVIAEESPVPDCLSSAAIQTVASDLRRRGKVDECEKLQRRLLVLQRGKRGPDDWDTPGALAYLTETVLFQGKLDDALKLADETIALSRRVCPDSDICERAMEMRSEALSKQGKLDDALSNEQELVRMRRRVFGPDNPRALYSMCNMVALLARLNRIDEAQKLKNEILKLIPADSINIRNALAWTLCTLDAPQIRDGQQALELATKACVVANYKVATCLNVLACAYAEVGDFKSAVKWAEKAVDLADGAKREKYAKHQERFKSGKPWREQMTLTSAFTFNGGN